MTKPFWPLGRVPIEETETFLALGLKVEGGNRAWLAVWRLNSDEPSTQVPIGFLKDENPEVEQLFPQSPERPSDWTGSALKVAFPGKYTAALYRLAW